MEKDGVRYYSIEAAAKLIGVTKPALKKMLVAEAIEYNLFKPGGPIWIVASSFEDFLRRMAKPKR